MLLFFMKLLIRFGRNAVELGYLPSKIQAYLHRQKIRRVYMPIFITSKLSIRFNWEASGRARDSWSGGRRFNPRCGCPLPTDWVGVNIM